jgi:alpha-L-arabinofuranosidase
MMSHISPRWMQGIGVHYYTSVDEPWSALNSTDFGEDQYFNGLSNALKMEKIVSKHSAIMDKYDPQKRIAFIVDEWGIVLGREAAPDFFYQQNALRDALMAASTLNIFNNHCERVRMANLAQTVNVLQSLVLTSGDSMVLKPTYYVFDLFKAHQNAKWAPLKMECPNYTYNYRSIPSINASASIDSNGVTHISLVNLDPNHEMPIIIHLNESIASNISGQMLTSGKFNDVNTFSEPNKVIIHFRILKNMPPKSVVMLEIN